MSVTHSFATRRTGLWARSALCLITLLAAISACSDSGGTAEEQQPAPTSQIRPNVGEPEDNESEPREHENEPGEHENDPGEHENEPGEHENEPGDNEPRENEREPRENEHEPGENEPDENEGGGNAA